MEKKQFRWAVGVESSCIPHLSIDQYQWTQHDKFWREDFRRVAHNLGCKWMRYSLPWHLIESRPGQFDWSWAQERLGFARELGIEVILDLVHFGTPTWLPDSFGDPDFPLALERFTEAFAREFRGVVSSVCPLNEPLITALFCGDIGLWPPHGRGLRSYAAILSRVAQGVSRSVRVLRESMPEAEVLVCDALEFPTVEENAEQVASAELMQVIRENLTTRLHRRHIVIDLITGRVDSEHPLYPWLEKNGFSSFDMNWFLRNPVELDLLGLDYYCHSEMELYPCGENHFRQRVPAQLSGLNKAVRDYWRRYRLPIMITETSYYGSDDERGAWLDATVADIRRLRGEGVPIVGYTWWPLLDHLDWDGAMLHQVGKIHHVGIFSLQRQPNGELTRHATPLTEEYRKLASTGEAAAGKLKVEARLRPSDRFSAEKTDGVAVTGEKNLKRSEGRSSTRVRKQLEYPIIVHCHLRWDGVWQRPQQFLSRLSRNHRVLFVEGPLLIEADCAPRYQLRQVAEHPQVTVMQTFFPANRFNDGAWVDGERLRLLEQALHGELAGQFERPVQWFYDPMAAPCFIGKLEESAVVYDCMDELSQFKFAPPEILARERQLLRAADVVFVGGRKLHHRKSEQNRNAHFYGCGVEVAHFSKARASDTVIPFDLDFIHRPILGYFGVVDERLDYELISKLADANPDWSVVMIGPVAKVDPNALPNRVNIYWVGRRDYTQLPAYTKAFTACLMPFALNEATEFINPTKALEYMATGKPIVSSAVPDVISNFGEVVKVANSHDEFLDFCKLAIESPIQFAIDRGLKLAEENSWEAIVAKMENHIRDVLKRKASRHWSAEPTREAVANV